MLELSDRKSRSLLLAAGLLGICTPAVCQEDSLDPFLHQRLVTGGGLGGAGTSFYRENYITAVMREFRRTAGDDQVLDAADLERIRSVQGLVQRSGSSYRIIKAVPRFPPGLNGAHSVRFVLASGVPAPDGSPGHSSLMSEESGELLRGIRQRNTPRIVDPFANL